MFWACCFCPSGCSWFPHVKVNDLSGGMSTFPQRITQEEPSLLYGEKRASSAVSVENKERKENHRSVRKFQKSPLCCTAAALSIVLSSSLSWFLYLAYENTSMPQHFLDSKIIIQGNNENRTTELNLSELMVEINLILLLNCYIVQFGISLQKPPPKIIVLPSAVPVKVRKSPVVMSS